MVKKVGPTNFFLSLSGGKKLVGPTFSTNSLISRRLPGKWWKFWKKLALPTFFRTSGSEKVGGANFFHQFLDFQEVSRKMVEILEKVGPTNLF